MRKKSLFFSKTNIDAIHTEEHFLYLCDKILNPRGSIELDTLYGYIDMYYAQSRVNYSAFVSTVSEHYKVINGRVYRRITGFVNDGSIYIDIPDKLQRVSKSNYDLDIRCFWKDPGIVKKLDHFGFNTVHDIVNGDTKTLISAFDEPQLLLNALDKMQKPYLQYSLKTISDSVGKVIDDRTLDVILKRNGFFAAPSMTLEAIGQEYGTTRERIRQIEKKGMQKLLAIAGNSNSEIEFIVNKYHGVTGKPYCTTKELENLIGNKNDFLSLMLLIIQESTDLKYIPKYYIIFNTERIELQDIFDEVLDKYGDFISLERYNNCSELEKIIIDNNYTFQKDNQLYKRRTKNLTILADEIVYKYFPDGYRYYDSDDYDRFKEFFRTEYGENSNPPTTVSLRGLLGRNLFCQYDRGSVISKRSAVKLSNELLTDIIDYIGTFEDIVYYVSIYEKFETELKEYGVTNRYYLKGVIDDYLPLEYTTKRDYISLGDEFMSSNDSVNNYIDNSTGVITMDSLKEEYPGVKDYTFQNIMYNRDDIVWLSGKEFILVKNLEVSDNLKSVLKEEIEYLFKSMDMDVISIGKLYSRMIIMHEDLMSTIPLIDNKSRLGSLVKCLFDKDYHISRQYISKDENASFYRNSLIYEYVEDKDSFSRKEIKDYVQRTGIRDVYSYQDFMINVSEDFVQVNVDTCVRKELVGIDDNKLSMLCKEIDYYINSFGAINTNIYNGYGRFPNVNYEWNKYLLVGIIRTYLDDKYHIEYTDSVFTKTEFIIGRAQNG